MYVPTQRFFQCVLSAAEIVYHDNGKRHSESRDTSEERRRSYESHRSRIHPHPKRIRRDASVDVDEHTADCSTVKTSDKPA